MALLSEDVWEIVKDCAIGFPRLLFQQKLDWRNKLLFFPDLNKSKWILHGFAYRSKDTCKKYKKDHVVAFFHEKGQDQKVIKSYRITFDHPTLWEDKIEVFFFNKRALNALLPKIKKGKIIHFWIRVNESPPKESYLLYYPKFYARPKGGIR